MRRTRVVVAVVCPIVAAVLVASGETTAAPASAAVGPRVSTQVWRVDLARGATDVVNMRSGAGGLDVDRVSLRPAARGGDRGYATEILPVHRLTAPADIVGARLTDRVPAGSSVSVDVRGRLGDGAWSEWLTVAGGRRVRLDRSVNQVQARVTLWTSSRGASPSLRALTLSASQDDRRLNAPTTSLPLTYTIFATDEGLVGGTTANGHVIQPDDHFVALPSGSALAPKGSDEYAVRVCYQGRCQTDPVWDTGPWNVQDNYWDPSSQRHEFADLPQGTPEAQAAMENGYNDGLDDEGRQITNPSGIDLADGAFKDLGLNDNAYVQVTFLWT